MSSMVTRWPVLVSLPVLAGYLHGEGQLTDAAVERLFAQARRVYFQRCETVDESTLELRGSKIEPGSGAVGDNGVTVSVGVVEVFPDNFTMTARLRPADGDGVAATAWCSLSPVGDVSNDMRDEFIALAHTAKYLH